MGISTDLIYDVKRKMLAKYPRFGSEIAVANIEFKENLPYHTAATDGKNVYVDPNYFESLSENERIFTIAHEIGHFFLHKDMLISDEIHVDILYRMTNEQEKEVDYFAGALLMNKTLLEKAYKDGHSITELAELFDVSVSAMTVRLDVLGLL